MTLHSRLPPLEEWPDITKVSILGTESIHLGFHLTEYIVHTVLSALPSSTYVLITDTNIAPLFLQQFHDAFVSLTSKISEEKIRFISHIIAPGEISKSREVKSSIEDFLFSQSCTRDTVILALGGGVVGDLVGFVAATFMRGVPFVQIPTTLLAMVDSSVGGKTAIDVPAGKNLIGAFWQPKYVFIDLSMLETLPEREFINGMAEVIKTAAIWNEIDFVKLENGVEAIRSAALNPSKTNSKAGFNKSTRTFSQSLLLDVVQASIGVKAHVVTVDERETGLRNLVNFGHSIGHAIEAILFPKILHGECVSIGMVLEAELSRYLGHLSQASVGRLSRCLAAYGLPVHLDDKRIKKLTDGKYVSANAILDFMKLDKKNAGNKKKVVLLSRIGATWEQKASIVSDSDIYKVVSNSVKITANLDIKRNIVMSTPGSKSISNRALLLAALGKGICRITNLLTSDDTQVMLTALKQLGAAEFEWQDNGDTLVIHGSGGENFKSPDKELYLGNAGTAARFLTTVCTLLPHTLKIPTILTGNARMKQRPIGPLVDALRGNGSKVEYLETEGCPPLALYPGGLTGGEIRLAASVSSQYVSSILLCAPYASKEPVKLVLTGGKVISQPYIDMTIAMMKSFGINVRRVPGEDIYHIPQGVYKNPTAYKVESDASSSTYPLAVAAITGTTVTLDSIGADSLQGDARFAVDVLRPMGCKVEQTASSTTVQGPSPGYLKPLPYIDMEPMTDAFLTATVLAAVANDGKDNITRIHGIANQRVKECNRIEAMRTELAKFGVHTEELEDGIEIHGVRSLKDLKVPDISKGGVKCYDDHRVAMSFSVLSCALPNGGAIISEKKCVEKTWPSWWDDLENKLGVHVEGIDLGPEFSHSIVKTIPTKSNSSIVLIGMRGAGKSTMGQLATRELDYKFIDMDVLLQQELQMGLTEFVENNGWEHFREVESKSLGSLLSNKATGHVIACGGGIVETEVARGFLQEYIKNGGIVIHIARDFAEIEQYLSGNGMSGHRPAWGEDIKTVWQRRQRYFEQCSNYEFVSLSGEKIPGGISDTIENSSDELLLPAGNDFVRLLRFITGKDLNYIDSSLKKTYFLSLTYPDVKQTLPVIDTITEGVNAIEVRVDLLKSPTEISYREYISHQLALIRRNSSLPIIFTIRTVGQGGKYSDQDIDGIIRLLRDGLKWGCEYIDIEITLPEDKILQILSFKGNSKIIASYHDWSGKLKWHGNEIEKIFSNAKKYGDLVKIIGKANALDDNFAIQNFVKQHTSKPIIAINMGSAGQISRILNNVLTPVTHPLLPFKAAPGQISVKEIQQALHLMGEIPAKSFYLFGTPISHSPSPTLHNTGFQTLGLPHKYELAEYSTVDNEETKQILFSSEFGGASVTIPHKITIQKYLNEMTTAASKIGAVNTIIPRDGKLIGDNTDWIGIRNVICEKLGKIGKTTNGLVIGAGGTSRAAIYALYQLGAQKIYIYNRTYENAINLVKNMQIDGLEAIKEIPVDLNVNVIVSTIPGTSISSSLVPKQVFSRVMGIGLDMAYKPRRTAFLESVKENGWIDIEGVEVLIAQGLEQFRLWTGLNAPIRSIKKAVYSFHEQ